MHYRGSNIYHDYREEDCAHNSASESEKISGGKQGVSSQTDGSADNQKDRRIGAPSRQFIAGSKRLKLSMKVRELASQLSKYIERGHAEDTVVIALRERSFGPEAAEEVKYCYVGFDWDNGRIFLVPEEPLVHYGNDRDKIQPAVRISYRNNYDGKIKPTLHCQRCEAKLSKEMRYCPKCGQRVDTENVRDAMI